MGPSFQTLLFLPFLFATEKPQLAQAYAFQINATLHTNDPQAILDDSLAMLHAVPYTNITDETLNAQEPGRATAGHPHAGRRF